MFVYYVFIFHTTGVLYHCNTVEWIWWNWISLILKTISSYSALIPLLQLGWVI